MKKLLVALFALSLLLSLTALAETDGAQAHECGDYTYVILDDGTAEITEYSGSEKELDIPSELDGRLRESVTMRLHCATA